MISVIIPHYNDLENLAICLDLLSVQTLQRDLFEIVVSDNNSQCGLKAVDAVCAGRAKAVLAFAKGAAEARNFGVNQSRGLYLAFIDSDCRPARDWLEFGLRALKENTLVGGNVEVEVENIETITAVEAFEIVFAFNFKRYIEKQNFSGTGNMFVSRKVFESVGGFRAGVSEDKDWGQRAVAKGYHWKYAAEVKVSHPARKTWADLREKWRRVTKQSYLLSKDQPYGRILWVLRAWAILFSPFLHFINIFRCHKLKSFSSRIKAAAMLFRIRWWRFFESHRVLFEP